MCRAGVGNFQPYRVAVLALALLFWRRAAVADPADFHSQIKEANQGGIFAYLGVPAVWMCFAFFLFITTAFGAIQNFATPILQSLYGLSLTTAATALSAYLLGGAGGI